MSANDITIAEEKNLNNGLGLKLNCFKEKKFGVLIYFKSGLSSKIVFENTPDDVVILFNAGTPKVETTNDSIIKYTVPIHAKISITTRDV